MPYKTDNLYSKIYSLDNLLLAYEKARENKEKKPDVKEFKKNLLGNLLDLHYELRHMDYKPKPLKTFPLRDPKTRKISKSDFRDRVVHHAVVNILESIFDKGFIDDSCANRIGKGSTFALKRFDKFKKKASNNGTIECYCLKADIKHYFQEVNHKLLLRAIKRRVKNKKVIWLIKRILENNVHDNPEGKGMPLGNLTSQFFANVYLHELDRFVKHELKAKYYIRYVDDFVILHKSKSQLEIWKEEINNFLNNKLNLELHPDKSKI